MGGGIHHKKICLQAGPRGMFLSSSKSRCQFPGIIQSGKSRSGDRSLPCQAYRGMPPVRFVGFQTLVVAQREFNDAFGGCQGPIATVKCTDTNGAKLRNQRLVIVIVFVIVIFSASFDYD
jgi:hypothetical protein